MHYTDSSTPVSIIFKSNSSSCKTWHKHLGHMSKMVFKILVWNICFQMWYLWNWQFKELYIWYEAKSFIHDRWWSKENKCIRITTFRCIRARQFYAFNSSLIICHIHRWCIYEVWACTMKTKSDLLEIFQKFHVVVERETDKFLKCFMIDNMENMDTMHSRIIVTSLA